MDTRAIIEKKESQYETLQLDLGVFNDLSIIITCYNQKSQVISCLTNLLDNREIEDIIILDNGSNDGTSEVLSQIGARYIYFDDGFVSYGKAWNALKDNFVLRKYCIFMDPSFAVNKTGLLWMIETLKVKDTGAAGFLWEGGMPPFDVNENILQVEDVYSDSLGVFGYIFGIRNEVMDEAGRFREDIVDPEHVMLEYGFRLLGMGYKNRISERSIARRNGEPFYSKDQLLESDDRSVLKKLFGMTYYNRGANEALCEKIIHKKEDAFSVLEVGCDLGATLLEIRRRFPNAITKGLEINSNSVNIAKHLGDIQYGNIEELKIPFDIKFDYIIFGDVLEHLHNAEAVVNFCRSILNPGGCIIANIPNIMHISVMEGLLDGRFTYADTGLLDRTHVHFFTYYEIVKLFNDAGFEIISLTGGSYGELTERQKSLIEVLSNLSEEVSPSMYMAVNYAVLARIGD